MSLKDKLLLAVKLRCQECAPDNEPAQCEEKTCSFWVCRFGEMEGRRGATWLRRQIRLYCIECCGDSPAEVSVCRSLSCAFWPWRIGRTEPDQVDDVGSEAWDCIFGPEVRDRTDKALDKLFGE